MSAPLPIGVIGVGSLGRHHARHLATFHGARLVGLYDLDPARSAAVAHEVGAPAFADLDALLREVEAVTVAVPTSAHLEVGLQALDAGVPVLMEKPLAATVEQARALVEAAEARGLQLQVGHIERFNRAIRAAGPHLGDLRYFDSTRLAPFQPRGTDVPVVLDLMIHDLDLILHLTGGAEAVDVRASGVAILSPHLDIATARVEFSNGAVASVTASRVARVRARKLRMFQTNGYFSLDLAEGSGGFMRVQPGFRPGLAERMEDVVEHVALDAPRADTLGLELATFVRAVRGGHEPVVTGREGCAAVALAVRVTEAIHPALVGAG